MRSVLFVCTANICRSPMAEAALRSMLAAKGMDSVTVDSAGTHDFHVGEPLFKLAAEVAARRGYDSANCIARAVRPGDFDAFDHILVMDRANLSHLRTICPTRCKSKIELLLEYGERYHGKDVPDPYGRSVQDFELAMDMIEDGCRGILLVLSRAA